MSWTMEKRKQALKRWALMRGRPYIQYWLGRDGRMVREIGMERVDVRMVRAYPMELEARYRDGMRLALRWVDGQPVAEWKTGRFAG